ncbi:MAG TPA: NYN domain-containing protein [Candidatus Dormibacteraeota bacterium]|nr:NYN domain-containing protein [Candidatus Dormibacteraeota bacterium]
MGRTELLVDGTNIAWAWPRSRPCLIRKDHAGAQRLLVTTATQSALRSIYSQLTFVFDGPPPSSGPGSSTGVRVLYPDPGQSADDRIVDLVAQAVHGGTAAVVATSDRGLRDLVRREGGSTIGGDALIQKLDPRGTNVRGAGASPVSDREEKPGPSSRDTEAWLQRFSKKRRPAK